MSHRKYDRYELMESRFLWREPATELLSDEKKAIYQARKRAVDMYIDGEDLESIAGKTGIDKSHVVKFVDRCLERDKSGNFRGYSSLCPWKCHREKKNSIGPFEKLLSQHEELKDFIEGNYFGYEKYTLEKNMNLVKLHGKFLKECQNIGIGADDYPFNTSSQGYQALRRYVKGLEECSVKLANRRSDKDAAQKAASTGYGENYSPLPVAPYSRGQIDGHRLDMLYISSVELGDGTVIEDICERCWFLPTIDVASRCIVGFYMSQEPNYNQFDLLKAMQCSFRPHEKVKMTIEGLDHPEKEGFPSQKYPQLEYALFDEIMLDNAKAHLAKNIVGRVTEKLGITLNYGAVSTPETRGIVERFFRTIEERGFHALPGTVGSNSHDLRRNNPEKQALKYRITFDDICQIMEILVIEYNNSPHSGLLNRTPLEVLGERLEQGMIPHTATARERQEIEKLLLMPKEVTVRGSIKSGKRPYVTYLGAKYRGNILSVNYEFLGDRLLLMVNPDDISAIDAYASDGTFIETLRAVGEYGRKKHSLKTRKLALKYANDNKKKHSDVATPLTDIEQSLRKRASKSKKARTRYDIIQREQGPDRKEKKSAGQNKQAELISISARNKILIKHPDGNINDMTSEETWMVIMNEKAGRE